MAPERVAFASGEEGGLLLEGVLHRPDGPVRPRAVMLLHPHPMGGGCMDVGLLATLADTLERDGYAPLRFNCRGVGGSEGRFSGGEDEVRDVDGAARWLASREDLDASETLIAGWSFGAWLGTRWCLERDVAGALALVSPPTAMFDFRAMELEARRGRTLIVAGEADQFSSPEHLLSLAERLPAELELLGGVDHFLFGHEGEVARSVSRFFSRA